MHVSENALHVVVETLYPGEQVWAGSLTPSVCQGIALILKTEKNKWQILSSADMLHT